jgi:hypothetical protein
MIIKKKLLYIILIFSTFLFGGFIFFIFKRNFLIVKFVTKAKSNIISESVSQIYNKKDVPFYYFKDNKFNFENKRLVWFKDKSKLLKHLVNIWLVFLQEERIIKKKITLDVVLLDKTGTNAFFSFDQILFEDNWSIYDKWNFIESLLKTIKESGIRINKINFLIDHKRMQDEHLDFSDAWPIDGYY